MERYLLFDTSCITCDSIAHMVERECQGWVIARSIYDTEMMALLVKAGVAWKHSPTLIEVEQGHIGVYRGMRLRGKMVSGLGIRRSWKIATLASQERQRIQQDKSRRQFFKHAGLTLGGLAVALGASWYPSRAAQAKNAAEEEDGVSSEPIPPSDTSLNNIQSSAAVAAASQHFGSPDWNAVHRLTAKEDAGGTGYFVPLINSESQSGQFLLIDQAWEMVGQIIDKNEKEYEVHCYTPQRELIGTFLVNKENGATTEIASGAQISSRVDWTCFRVCLTSLGLARCIVRCFACVTIIGCVPCMLCMGMKFFKCARRCR